MFSKYLAKAEKNKPGPRYFVTESRGGIFCIKPNAEELSEHKWMQASMYFRRREYNSLEEAKKAIETFEHDLKMIEVIGIHPVY